MSLIYVVEDDDALRKELCALLEVEGFDWIACDDFSRADELILQESPDCVILDALLPDVDGRVIARKVRASSAVPIIMLTCLDSDYDEVIAMNQGVDDYLNKPYRPAVLIAHVRAALRRGGLSDRPVVSHKGLSLDLGSGVASFGAGKTELTRNEVRILSILMKNPGTVISRQEIMCELWESDAFIDDNTLTVNINRLRKALGGIGVPDDFITTRRGEGYLV